MGGIVESQVADAAEAIMQRDTELAARVVEADPRVDAIEREVEQFVIRMLALRQPMAQRSARDRRRAQDLQRHRAHRRLRGQRRQARHRADPEPAHAARRRHRPHGPLVQQIIKDVLDADGAKDADKAMAAWKRDQDVDDMYNRVFREMLTYMMEDPRNIAPCTHLMFIAKNIERIGDHATNIAEIVHYVVWRSIAEARPKGDT